MIIGIYFGKYSNIAEKIICPTGIAAMDIVVVIELTLPNLSIGTICCSIVNNAILTMFTVIVTIKHKLIKLK